MVNDDSSTYRGQNVTPVQETDSAKRSSSSPVTLLSLGIFISIVCLFTSCDEPFQATKENGRYHFSIYGYLDASLDTQWVRVTPVRDSITTNPNPIDGVVTLEDLNTGESTVMNDSLFTYLQNAYAWNFWTTMDLEPSHTYKLTAEDSDGNQSSVVVTLPDDYPAPIFRTDLIDRNIIEITGIELLIDIQTIYHIDPGNGNEIITEMLPQLEDTVRNSAGDYFVRFNPMNNEEFIRSSYPNGEVVERQIYVAAAAPGTPHFPSIDDFVFSLPEGVSNIEQGVGYLAGVLTKTIPYETCYDESGVNVIPCPEELPL